MPDPIDPNDPDWVNKYLASVGGTTTTTTTGKPATQTYAQGSAADKGATQLAGGWQPHPPQGSVPIGPGSVMAAGITWHQDPTTLNWAPGYATTKTEATLAANVARSTGVPQGTTLGGTQTIMPGAAQGANPMAGAPNLINSLGPSSGVTIPGLDPFVGAVPGGISSEGRHNLPYGAGGNTDLNTIYGGHQGSASRDFPTTPGFRGEGQYGNSINFAGGGGLGGSGGSSSGGRIEPQNLLPGVQVNVPDSYVRDQGNSGDANRAYQVPFNIGPNSTAGLMNVGGNNVQVNSPLVNGGSTGMGYALNAAPASNVFALTGRQGSADPATQAAQILQLQTAIQDGKLASLMEPNQNQFGGYHAGSGNGFFSGNGGQAQTNLWNTANPTAPAPAPAPAAYPGWYTNPATGGPAISPTNPGSLSAIGNIWSGGGNMNGHPTDTGAHISPPSFTGSAGLQAPQPSVAAPAAAPQTQAQQQSQSYAAAVAAIQDQRDRAEGSYGDYYGGGGPDGGQRGFSRGGSVTALDPFGGMQHYAAGGSMTTTEPIVGIGVYSGQKKFIVGEDGTGDGRPDAERLSFPNPNQLQITPLHHTAAFAGGGTVQAQGPTPFSNEWYLQQIREQEAKAKEQRPIDWGGVYSISPQLAGGGAYAQQQQAMAPPPLVRIDPGGINMPTFATGGSVTIDPMQQPRAVTAPPPAQDTAAPPSSTPPVTGTNSNVPPGFDPLDPAALAPWQKAQQQLGYQQHLRDTIDNPRRQAGGLGGSTGVAVLQGDTPAANLGAGVYYDQRPQVQNMVDQIVGNRANLNALGPKEDIEPIIGQVSQIGIQLDTQQKLRDLATSRVAADAQDQVAKQQAVGKLGYLQADLVATQNALANAQNNIEYDPDPAARVQHIYDLAAKLAGIQGDITATNNLINGPGPALQAIDAEIGSLQNSLPPGFNEAEAKTQLALLNQRVSNQTKREQLTQQSYNLSKMGVPNLSAPLIPLNPLAPAHAATPAFAKGGKVTVKKPRSRSVKLPSGKKLTIEEADD